MMKVANLREMCEILRIDESTGAKHWRKWPHFFATDGRDARSVRFIPAADALKGFLTAREHNAIRSQDYRSKKPIMISEIKDLSTAQLMRVKGVGLKGAMNIKAAISSYYESKK